MILLILLACSCPSFEEMEVRDPDDLVDETVIGEIRTAISDFAAETGREGVCVPAVDVVERVPGWGGEPACGDSGGLHSRIRVSADAGCAWEETVTHELCHALDNLEGLSKAHPDEFPGDAIEEAYPKWMRPSEDFARSCEGGPFQCELDAAWDDACGDLSMDAGERMVQEQVYVDAPHLTVEDTDIALDVSERSLPLDGETQVLDATGVDGELWLTVWHYVGEQRSTRLLRLDPVTGDVLGDIELARLGDDAPAAKFAMSDSDPIVLVDSRFGDGPWAVERVDPSTGRVERLGWVHQPVNGSAWSEGVLYVGGWDGEDRLAQVWIWSGGEQRELVAPGSVRTMRPIAGGVEAYTSVGLARFDQELSTWSTMPTLGGWEGFARWSDTQRLFLAFGGTADVGDRVVFLDVETGAIGLPVDPCTEVNGANSYLWAEVGGAVLLVWSGQTYGEGLLHITVISPAGT